MQVTPAPWSWMLAMGREPRTVCVNDIRTAGSGVGTGSRAAVLDWSAWLSWRAGAAWLYDRTLFLNDAGARWLLGAGWARRADVVPLGVCPEFLRADRGEDRRDESRPVEFVYVGTIALARNLERMLEAADLVSRAGMPFRLTLLGPDDGAGGRDAIQALIVGRRLEHCVDLMNPVPYEQVPAVLRRFDVALNYVPDTRVQRRQTFLKVLECRALGLPQITTRTAPNEAVVQEGETGLLVADSADSYAAAMRRVIGDRELLARLRRGAGEARSGLAWAEVAERYAAIHAGLARAADEPVGRAPVREARDRLAARQLRGAHPRLAGRPRALFSRRLTRSAPTTTRF